MTVLLESCMSLLRMHRSYIIDIDTASISRNIHVDVPIVADAKEAITKMNEYVEKCETKKWTEK